MAGRRQRRLAAERVGCGARLAATQGCPPGRARASRRRALRAHGVHVILHAGAALCLLSKHSRACGSALAAAAGLQGCLTAAAVAGRTVGPRREGRARARARARAARTHGARATTECPWKATHGELAEREGSVGRPRWQVYVMRPRSARALRMGRGRCCSAAATKCASRARALVCTCTSTRNHPLPTAATAHEVSLQTPLPHALQTQ